MRLSCVRLLRSSWLKVLSIITISDDGLERCREGRGNLLALCMSLHVTHACMRPFARVCAYLSFHH